MPQLPEVDVEAGIMLIEQRLDGNSMISIQYNHWKQFNGERTLEMRQEPAIILNHSDNELRTLSYCSRTWIESNIWFFHNRNGPDASYEISNIFQISLLMYDVNDV